MSSGTRKNGLHTKIIAATLQKRIAPARIAAKTRPQKVGAPSKNFGKIFEKLGKIFKNFTKFFKRLSDFLRRPCLRILQESYR